jgi:spore germination cell wall hydrolase CwlJ-like protein
VSAQSTAITALTCWRENRGGGYQGMQSVANAIANRAQTRRLSLYAVCTQPEQFSSLTAKGDPQLATWPEDDDPQWIEALEIAAAADAGELPDIIGGATNYYAASLDPAPDWAASMTFTVEIAGQMFFK